MEHFWIYCIMIVLATLSVISALLTIILTIWYVIMRRRIKRLNDNLNNIQVRQPRRSPNHDEEE